MTPVASLDIQALEQARSRHGVAWLAENLPEWRGDPRVNVGLLRVEPVGGGLCQVVGPEDGGRLTVCLSILDGPGGGPVDLLCFDPVRGGQWLINGLDWLIGGQPWEAEDRKRGPEAWLYAGARAWFADWARYFADLALDAETMAAVHHIDDGLSAPFSRGHLVVDRRHVDWSALTGLPADYAKIVVRDDKRLAEWIYERMREDTPKRRFPKVVRRKAEDPSADQGEKDNNPDQAEAA
ncbi:MAG: hypothetical protein MI755_16440 [Sphingomonadales bacterium]|nr:hypothetical protein [Sphingomonadales bacterium]